MAGATERRLAAFVAADTVGSSRRMQVGGIAALDRLRATRIEIIDPEITANNGRIFKTTGDGFLAEFPSAIEALNCAVDIQRSLGHRNADRKPLAAAGLP